MLKRAEKGEKIQIVINKAKTKMKPEVINNQENDVKKIINGGMDFFGNADVPIIGLRVYIGFAIFVFLFSFLGLINFDSSNVSGTIDVIDKLLFYGIMILVITWTYKHYKHLQKSRLEGFGHSPGRAIWGRIVPIACWIIPFNIMREIYKGYYSLKNKIPDWKTIELPQQILWWQILWITCSILIRAIPSTEESSIILLPILGFLVSCYLLISTIRKTSKLID